ncbi:D-ribose pyranase [Propionicicella superfundia]|uniref:D-ribose pyranase n=1 Tax=Propionicicella superfundia TaxID=348582 RepID=UPI0004252D39|nr:D-ribose pyranase [Propionicicella superfundia]
MKRTGIWNADLSYHLAKLGHTQIVFVVDAGMPLPSGIPTVDLALVAGVPTLRQVLDALLAEIIVAQSTAARESSDTVVAEWFAGHGLTPELVSHQQLKAMLSQASLIVRTGEATPFANVALHCGVPF